MSAAIDELRRLAAAAADPPPAAMDAYLAKVRERAYTVTDGDVEALKRRRASARTRSSSSTVGVALAEGLRRLDRAEDVIR